jgi:pilus assembly protein CpaB
MSPRTVIVATLALVFGGSAAVGVNSLIKSPPKGDVVPVVMAAADITRGGTITGDLLKTRDFPRELVPPGAITKLEDAIDRTVAMPLMRDDAILENKLAPRGAGRGMAALIPKGMRAFTITTTLASGVAGFILPGNKVDVILTITEGMAGHFTGGGSTMTLLHDVEILAVDQRIDAPAENKVDVKEMRSVTLLVSPDEANVLELGQSKGNLYLTLRNRDDRVAGKTRPATMLDLQLRQEMTWDQRAKGVMAALGEALAKARPIAPPAARREAPRKIRTLRGTNEGLVTVAPNDGS